MRDHSGFFIALNRKEKNIIRVFDVFSGIGGFRSGLEKAGGFEIIGWCEIDKYAKKAYETMYDTKGEVYFDDARKINQMNCPISTLYAQASLARAFQSLEKGRL